MPIFWRNSTNQPPQPTVRGDNAGKAAGKPPWRGGSMHLLLIYDDQRTSDFILRGLKEHGHVTDHALGGKDGLYLATTQDYDILIVDRMVSELKGTTIVKTLAHSCSRGP